MKSFHQLECRNATELCIDSSLSELLSEEVMLDLDQPTQQTKKATFVYDYMKNLKADYQFHLIEKILVQNCQLFFICKLLTSSYSKLFTAFKILEESLSKTIVSLSTLYTKEPFAIQTPYSNNEKYIFCKKTFYKKN